MCTRALGLYVDLIQLCQVAQAGHFPRAANPLQIAQAPLHTVLSVCTTGDTASDVATSELTFHLAQEQKELVWSE